MSELDSGKVVRHPRAASAPSTRSTGGSDSGWTKEESLRVKQALTTIAKEMAARGRLKAVKEVEALLPALHRDLQSFPAADVLEALRLHRMRSPHFPTLYDIAKIIDELRRSVPAAADGAGGRVFVLEGDPHFDAIVRRWRMRHPHPHGIVGAPRADGVTPEGRAGRGWYFDADIVQAVRGTDAGREEEVTDAMPF